MNKKLQVIILVMGFFSIILSSQVTAGNLQLNYNGQWYSGGFGDFSGWKNFVNFFIDTMLGVKIVEVGDKIGLVTTDPWGNENTNTNLVSFNKNTGALTFLMDVPLPGGKIEHINYNISLNGDYNISKYVDYTQFLNKSIKDILVYVGKEHLKIKFVGNYSNVTVIPTEEFTEANPSFNVTYEKNQPGNYSSPIIPENNSSSFGTLSENSTNSNVNNTQNITETENLTENSYGGSTSGKNNSKKEDLEFKIINPMPNASKIFMNLSEKRVFSIDNVNYDTIVWRLNEKIVKEKSNFYEFFATESGNFRLSVEIKRESVIKTNIWRVSIASEEKNNNELIKKVIIVLGLVVLMLIVLGVFMYFKKNQTNAPTKSEENDDSD